ncbi:SIS domain-containing protein [Rhodophyticola porphyridii]|uniref:SIS domain-containing protein n=1 Tax=Rhodophyticola porphyridii TaxID=1852017 RepID=A0A3L9Y429_9RHOB|nr:SIS domain-containing protein [Rhodophyticola porphyridii]RMA40876.1 SIS domain-containing protein [Rhodophyticola porphyridii]
MSDTTSRMRHEILEIPEAVARLLDRGQPEIAKVAEALKTRDPRLVVTVARGSSDHVCTFLKYAVELELGLPVASIGPSVASLYGAELHLDGALCLSVSQSGQSPDIVALAKSATRGGALSVAVTNDPASPLAEASDHCIGIHAGPERSVAATKTFVTSAVATLMLLAEWKGDDALRSALLDLPRHLDAAARKDWSPLKQAIGAQRSLFTLGRGPSWAISNEAALKFKETCQIHAESYSAAEVLHGPVSIVEEGFPVLCFTARDAAETPVVQVADALAEKGARVFVTSDRAARATALPHIRTDHRLTDPITLIVSFYAMVEQIALDRGIDPDTPRHLRKVTETV